MNVIESSNKITIPSYLARKDGAGKVTGKHHGKRNYHMRGATILEDDIIDQILENELQHTILGVCIEQGVTYGVRYGVEFLEEKLHLRVSLAAMRRIIDTLISNDIYYGLRVLRFKVVGFLRERDENGRRQYVCFNAKIAGRIQDVVDKLGEPQKTYIMCKYSGTKVNNLEDVAKFMNIDKNEAKRIEYRAMRMLERPKMKQLLRFGFIPEI